MLFDLGKGGIPGGQSGRACNSPPDDCSISAYNTRLL
jgi:hypothetical protein